MNCSHGSLTKSNGLGIAWPCAPFVSFFPETFQHFSTPWIRAVHEQIPPLPSLPYEAAMPEPGAVLPPGAVPVLDTRIRLVIKNSPALLQLEVSGSAAWQVNGHRGLEVMETMEREVGKGVCNVDIV